MNTNGTLDLTDLRVLVVDDDMGYRHLMANMLQNIGIGSVPMAATATDARTEIEDSSVDFVVLDRTLKGSGGVSLLKFLRDPEKTPAPHLPVIMSTDFGSVEHITAAIQSGADHVLTKPVSPAELEMTIRNLVAKPPEKIEVETYVGPCRRRLPQKLYGPYRGEDRRHDAVGEGENPQPETA